MPWRCANMVSMRWGLPMKRLFLAACVGLLLAAAQSFAGPYEDGLAAGQRGDYATALRLLKPLAEQGDARAQNLLGFMYADGKGVPQDDAEAMKWYRKAAEQGHTIAQLNLGIMYDAGLGVTQDNAEAMKWIRKAAEQGFAAAQVYLGQLYAKGRRGVPQDLVQAHLWYNLAAAITGNKDAVEYRDSLARRMTPAEIAEAQRLAQEWKPRE